MPAFSFVANGYELSAGLARVPKRSITRGHNLTLIQNHNNSKRERREEEWEFEMRGRIPELIQG